MLNPIELKFKADKDSKSAFRTEKVIKSHDIKSVEFHISFDGLELTENHTVKVLSIFHDTQSQTNVECEIVDGKAIYRPDTSLISQYEQVTSYVYVYLGDQSLDVREFTYSVGLSKIDETALKVKEVYDQSYSDLLENFDQALTDYKDTLPQADSVRAEIDVILDKFSLDGETAIGDFRQQADADAEAKLTEIQSDANQLFSGAVDQFKQDGKAEIADWRVENSNELANLQTETAKKANRKQEEWITPTLLNGFSGDLKYRKTQFNELQIDSISLQGGSIGQVIFVLPIGYRPVLPKIFIVGTSFSANFAKITISAGGNVTLTANGGGTPTLANITLPLD